MLPRGIRHKLGRAYRDGLATDSHPNREYVQAHKAALEWIATYEAMGDVVDKAKGKVQV
jgi:hypothetical protein